jgi:hypothetical protein
MLGLRRVGLCETHDTYRELIGAIHTSSDRRKLGPIREARYDRLGA